jgi:phenylalanyl-tRNA synthetase beta chain
MFEVGDVVLKDPSRETGTRNERRLCALYTNLASQIEVIHGLLDYVMMKLNVKNTEGSKRNYKLVPANGN